MSSRRVLVVVCHPVAESLIGTAAAVCVDALGRAGHEVEVIDLYAEGFDPRLSLEEWRAQAAPAPPPPGLERHARLLGWAHTLVLVHPTWFGSQPAMLKGWFDRVFTNGVAFERRPRDGGIRPRLRNIRRIVVVTSHGSGRGTNAIQGEPGKRLVHRGLRSLCHPLCRTKWLGLYGVDRDDADDRARWLARIERWMLAS